MATAAGSAELEIMLRALRDFFDLHVGSGTESGQRDEHALRLATAALLVEVVRIDGPVIEYESRYDFPSREAFDRYEREHAPRLRAEGLRLFPTEHGVHYRRTTGIVTDQFPA
jgi:hypothetical protein